MNQDFSYTHDKKEGVISVVTPYNERFIARARNLRGNWKNKAWHFDDSIEEYVKQALLDCYGVTGEQAVEYCSLLIKDYSGKTFCGPEVLFDRTIAKARGRDSGADLGDDIVFISGKYKSGGSVKNWTTEIIDGHFEIRFFPLERTKFEDVQKAIAEGWCEIKMPKKKRTAEQIQADINKYTSLLEELKNELNNI